MSPIKIIAGLGNPGTRYEKTRHNIGFVVIDSFAARHAAGIKWRERSQAQVGEINFAGQPIVLVKPQSFMNRSGEPIREIMHFYKWEVSNLAIVHDELDLDVGTLRLKCGGGEGGHNGVRSVTDELGSGDYIRLRVGIGHPRRLPVSPDNPNQPQFEGEVHDWVLGRFSAQEMPQIEEVIGAACDSLEELLRGGLKAAQQRFNAKGKNSPPREG